MIEKTIHITVDVDNANKRIDKLDNSLKTLKKTGDKTDLSKGLNKSSEAMDFLDSKTKGLASGFVAVGKAAKAGGKAMKSALISSGIGILLVIVTEIVNNWDSIVEFIGGANDELQDQIDLGNERIKDLSFERDILEIQKKTLENQGKSTKEISKLIKEKLANELKELKANIVKTKLYNEQADAKALEYTWWQKIQVAAGGRLGYTKQITEEEKKQKEERDQGYDNMLKQIAILERKTSEINKNERDNFQKLQDDKFKAYLKENAQAEKRLKAEEKQREADRNYNAETQALLDEEEQLEIEREETRLQNIFDLRNKFKVKEEENKLLALEKQEEETLAELERLEASEYDKQKVREFFNAEKKKLTDKEKEDEIIKAEQIKDAKIAIAGQTLSFIGLIAKKGSKLAKGVAVAQTLMNTYQGVTSALSAPSTIPEPLGTALKFANAGIIGATGALNVKKILSTDETGQSISNGGSNISSGGGASAPSFNLVSGSGSNQIAESLANQDRPLRAFVVSGDVATAGELDRNIIENSSL